MIPYKFFFSFAFVDTLTELLQSENVIVDLNRTKLFERTEAAFYCLHESEIISLKETANVVVRELLNMEPNLCKKSQTISIRFDDSELENDGRDVVLQAKDDELNIGINWNLGVKYRHVRILRGMAPNNRKCIADIGMEWFGAESSQRYFDKMQIVVDKLSESLGKSWNSAFKDKVSEVYEPILDILKEEIRFVCDTYPEAPANMIRKFVEYYDFYEITPIARSEKVRVAAYNMNGTLGNGSCDYINKIQYPTRLIEVGPKELPNGELSRTMLALVFDNGWEIEMRIHNASLKIGQGGLVLDVKMVGSPHGIYKKQLMREKY